MDAKNGSFDLMSLLSGGGGGGGASGGFNLASLFGGASSSPAAAGSDPLTAALTFTTGFLPGVGPLLAPFVGPLLSGITGLFGGGGTPQGSSEFDGLHSPTLPPLAASSMKQPEAGIFSAYARGLGISVEEVALLLATDQSHNNQSVSYVVDAWRQTNLSNARIYMRFYNQQNPQSMIVEGQKGPLLATGVAPSPAAGAFGNSFTGGATVPLSQFGFTGAAGLGAGVPPAGMSWIDYLKQIASGALNGAQTGAGTAAGNTPAGQQIKKDAFSGFVQDYQLPLAAGLAGLVWVCVKAFNNSK